MPETEAEHEQAIDSTAIEIDRNASRNAASERTQPRIPRQQPDRGWQQNRLEEEKTESLID